MNKESNVKYISGTDYGSVVMFIFANPRLHGIVSEYLEAAKDSGISHPDFTYLVKVQGQLDQEITPQEYQSWRQSVLRDLARNPSLKGVVCVGQTVAEHLLFTTQTIEELAGVVIQTPSLPVPALVVATEVLSGESYQNLCRDLEKFQERVW